MDWPTCEYKTERARLRAKFATGLPSDYICEPGACRDGSIIGIYSGYNYGPCPACSGTGEARELTVDQAEAYARVRNPDDLTYRVAIFDTAEGWYAGYVERGAEECGFYNLDKAPDDNFCGEGKTIPEALSNFARAIKDSK